jgi:hypothetical protein
MDEIRFKRKKVQKPFPDSIQAKWSTDMLNEGFVPFPKRLMRCLPSVFEPSHIAEDLALVLAIADYRRVDLMRQPSIRYLAWNAGLSTERFVERLDALEEQGLVKRRGPDEEIEISLRGLEERVKELTPDEEF